MFYKFRVIPSYTKLYPMFKHTHTILLSTCATLHITSPGLSVLRHHSIGGAGLQLCQHCQDFLCVLTNSWMVVSSQN